MKIAIFLLILSIFLVSCQTPSQPNVIDSFEECVEAGNPVMESYPRQCRTQDGLHFVEEVEPIVI